MYIRRLLPRLAGVAAIAFWGSIAPVNAQAGQPARAPAQHEHVAPQTADEQAAPQTADPHAGHVTSPGDAHAGHDMASMARDGSGTSWLPDETPMYAFHGQANGWTLMGHGNVFLQYLHESGVRGSSQTGGINWLMGMASRPAGNGRFMARGMASAEPWTIRGCGYPDLLASGEVCKGAAIHDRQHPHDLFLELAAGYDRPLAQGVRLQLYAAPVGEPALGPVAFMHRLSGMPNPIAPITHHWFDATHIAYGVVTGGLYGGRWKAETSLFNGREPDEKRANFDFAALDSWSARVSLIPAKRWSLQVSGGHLTAAEAGHAGGPRVDVNRVTASAIYHRTLGDAGVWADTIGWGRNAEAGGEATNALLVETSLTLRDRDVWFGRLEWSQKTSHDLDLAVDDVFEVGKLQGGYTRYLAGWKGMKPGVGAALSAGIVPGELEAAYGRRVNAGAGVFVTLRPAAPAIAVAASSPAGHTMVMTATDPAKLTCPTPVDVTRVSSTIYNGTTYYFCSASDRDEFLKNPAMNVAMMPKP